MPPEADIHADKPACPLCANRRLAFEMKEAVNWWNLAWDEGRLSEPVIR
jgi:hypothetical protein